MKIGVIGLGDIAQKAYLPVLTALPGVKLHLHTRDRTKLARLAEAYRISDCYPSLDGLIGAGVAAAFVHAATPAHRPIVGRLLEAGIHVYVDKPLDDTLGGARQLVDLADRKRVSLMVGFNRRHAPQYAALRHLPRDWVLLRKHRAGLPAAPRTVVYDDFIHVVDTLRFLAPGAIDDERIAVTVRDGRLHQVVLSLSGRGFVLTGAMHRDTGAAIEVLEVAGPGAIQTVRDLTEVVHCDPAGGERRLAPDYWSPVARQRGIEQACLAFLDAIRAGRLLDGHDALATHEICERIVQAAGG